MEAIAANILLEGLAVNALAQCETPVTLVTTDSREVCPGCIFVAFPGEKFDGHDFAAKALENMDDRIAIRILSGMPPKQAGEILTYTNPQKTAEFSELISRMKSAD